MKLGKMELVSLSQYALEDTRPGLFPYFTIKLKQFRIHGMALPP